MKHINVATYNICHGRYAELDWSRIASVIREAGADIVGFQEIDMFTNRVGGLDTVAALTAATGLPHALFAPAMDYDGGQYGTAILSRYPITDSKTLNYPVTVATQGTSCGYAVLDVEGMSVTVFNTHLSVENEESNTETLCCLGDILATLRREGKSFLCCGDFNTSPKKVSRFIPWVSLAHNGLTTYADRSIDHILYFGQITVANTRTLNTQKDKVTDHNMVLTEVTV